MNIKSALEHASAHASISRSWVSALGLLALSLAAMVVACSADEKPNGLGGDFGPGDKPGIERCENGVTRECGVKVGEQDGVVTCYVGTQTCVGNVWQACGNGSVIETQSQSSFPGARFQALSPPQACIDNPCDPYCQNFKEAPDGGIVPEAGPPIFDWQGGSLSSYPGGLVTKGLKEPCTDGYDCQFNHQCQNPATGATCAHSKCQAGTGLDATCDSCVADVCAAEPSCCNESYSHSCDHDLCTEGSRLKASCDPCVKSICDDPAYEHCCKNGSGVWDSDCVGAVNSICGLSCPLGTPGKWTQSCVDKTESICNVQCGESAASTCSHNPCDAGEALDGTCNECVSKICKADPYCCIYYWDSICQGEVASVCGESCPLDLTTPPASDGECVAWAPGQTNASCDSWDVALGVPCTGQVPVCNHGTKEAPAGLKIVHYPANAGHYPSCDPGTQANMETCVTTEPIAPGKCINVTCGLTNGNREIMVNPGPAVGGSIAGECSCRDNWTLYSGTATCGEPVCSGGESEAIFKNVHLIFMMDKSGSMEGSRWNGTTQALKAFFSDSESAGLYASLEFFPLSSSSSTGDGCGSTCTATPCANPMVADGMLQAAAAPTDAQEQKLVNAIDGLSPGGGTPTEPALRGALDAAIAGTTANPGDIYVVVLATDGEPTECNTSTYSHSEMALSAYIDYGIRTYAIGMEGANISGLNQIAKSGGTGGAFVVGSGSVEQDLVSAFKAIAGQNVNCSFTVENPDNIEPDDSEVIYTPKTGSEQTLPRVNDESACGSGWYYDNNTTPTSVTLCPATCAMVKADTAARVSVTIGCKKTVAKTVQSEIYEGTCTDGYSPQWSYLTYNTTTPGDSNVEFLVRTAQTEAELASATFVSVATAQASTNTQTCGMGGPAPCPIDLYSKLGGNLSGRFRFLELQMVLNPSTDKLLGPTLTDWRINYSCPPDQ